MLTLRQMRYLDALARHRHFGRPAEECGVSQPALSMQIHEFEEFRGVELLERRCLMLQGIAEMGGMGCKLTLPF
jgi:LysR family transcriptional regulator, hydrogen peroxide-inducible genes activator